MTPDTIGTEMMDPTSWIQLHICNHMGQCCTSGRLDSLKQGKNNYRSTNITDPCHGLVMEKSFPNYNGQMVEVEHFGPDGTTLENVLIHVEYETRILCHNRNGPDEKLVFPDGARTKMFLNCSTTFIQVP